MLLYLLPLFAVGEVHSRAHARFIRELEGSTPEFEETVSRWLAWGHAAHEAVATQIPFLLNLLHDQDTEIAAIAAYALSCFPERATQLAPELRAALDQDLHVTIKAACILSLGVLVGSQSDYPDFYRSIIHSDASGPIRLAAVMALARALRESAPDDAIQLLTAAKDNPGWDQDVGAWSDADMRAEPDSPFIAMWRTLSGQDDPMMVAGGLVPDYVCSTYIG
jgi:hypothetical protein